MSDDEDYDPVKELRQKLRYAQKFPNCLPAV